MVLDPALTSCNRAKSTGANGTGADLDDLIDYEEDDEELIPSPLKYKAWLTPLAMWGSADVVRLTLAIRLDLGTAVWLPNQRLNL